MGARPTTGSGVPKQPRQPVERYNRNVMLDRGTLIGALKRLGELLQARGVEGEICLLGGAVMVLAFNARPSTKDVDAIFEPASVVRRLAREVALEQDLPEDWLNDGAKGFISSRHETTSADVPQFPGLRLTVPTPEYMLAMKCMASRIGTAPDVPGDVADIRFLIKRLGLTSAAQARDIVARYYPEAHIPPRVIYLLDDLFTGMGTTS